MLGSVLFVHFWLFVHFCNLLAQDSSRRLPELPLLVQVEDRGPDSFCAQWFEIFVLRLRTWNFDDPWHLLHNGIRNAAAAAGLSSMIHLTSLVIEIGHGPWSGTKWFQVIQETVQEHLAKGLGKDDPILQSLLPRITEDKGWSDLSDESLADQALRDLTSARFMFDVGPTTQASRWCSWLEGWAYRDADATLLLYALLLYCIEQRFVDEDPGQILKTLSATLTEPSKAAAASSSSDTPLKDAKDITQRLRSRCKNKLHICTLVLADRGMVLQARQFYLCCVPLRKWYAACRHELRSRESAKDFHLNLAKGSGLISVAQVLQTCRDASVCQRMGILLQELSSDKRFVKLDVDSAEVLTQDNLCHQIWRLMIALAQHRVTALASIMWSFPHQFLLLAGTIEANECYLWFRVSSRLRFPCNASLAMGLPCKH